MAAYDYRCPRHGEFERRTSIGAAGPVATCDLCGAESPRVYHPPLTRRSPSHLAAAIDKAEKSRHEPEVVSSPPRRPAHRRTPIAPPNPAFKNLPRP